MANTVDTFRGISILIFKWLLFAVLGIVGIALLIGGVVYAYNYLTYERHAANVEIIVATKNEKGTFCKDSPGKSGVCRHYQSFDKDNRPSHVLARGKTQGLQHKSGNV